MMEIAICLAIIGIALVGIIGVLPYGMNTQRDNREETIIGQDANMLLELIRNGSHGADDLTNYVYAIVNTGSNPVGYTNGLAGKMGFLTSKFPSVSSWSLFLTNGENIVGLLTTPEYVDANNTSRPIPGMNWGGISNHVAAYARSMSGLAADKPPQDNAIMVGDSFAYRILCVNASVAIDTNQLNPVWQAQNYPLGAQVFKDWNLWQASEPGALPPTANDIPGVPPIPATPRHINPWLKIPFYPLELAANQHEFRLTFTWPVLPNGKIGSGRQTFRQTIPGGFETAINAGTLLYFSQPGFFKQN